MLFIIPLSKRQLKTTFTHTLSSVRVLDGASVSLVSLYYKHERDVRAIHVYWRIFFEVVQRSGVTTVVGKNEKNWTDGESNSIYYQTKTKVI